MILNCSAISETCRIIIYPLSIRSSIMDLPRCWYEPVEQPAFMPLLPAFNETLEGRAPEYLGPSLLPVLPWRLCGMYVSSDETIETDLPLVEGKKYWVLMISHTQYWFHYRHGALNNRVLSRPTFDRRGYWFMEYPTMIVLLASSTIESESVSGQWWRPKRESEASLSHYEYQIPKRPNQ